MPVYLGSQFLTIASLVSILQTFHPKVNLPALPIFTDMNQYFLRLSMAVLLSGSTIVLQAQTPAGMRMSGINKRQVLEEHSLVSQVPFRNIGPSIMSGRVTDLAVNPDKPEEFYVAYASGGLWYTNNNGQSFQPLFQQEDVMTIGAIAVNWETGVIWVGTGEVNSSRSSYAGIGMYKVLTEDNPGSMPDCLSRII